MDHGENREWIFTFLRNPLKTSPSAPTRRQASPARAGADLQISVCTRNWRPLFDIKAHETIAAGICLKFLGLFILQYVNLSKMAVCTYALSLSHLRLKKISVRGQLADPG
ncbi:MAG: hypothetical protein DRH37_06260 [Deltaproteobacteria bacterium]|nr:MAG: hypothetical protein DRH37_06260 [Deltaproteobacteria bacterium]